MVRIVKKITTDHKSVKPIQEVIHCGTFPLTESIIQAIKKGGIKSNSLFATVEKTAQPTSPL